jgi:hypothetical protein
MYGYEIAPVANISATRGSCSCNAIALVLAAGEALQTPLANGGAGLDWSAVSTLSAWEAGGPSPTARD